MKKSPAYLLYGILISFLLIACNSEETLQTYFVDHLETPDFMSADIPTSVVNLDKATLTLEQKAAYKSVERLNFLGFKINDTNGLKYDTELTRVKAILNTEKYNELMEFSDSGNRFVIKYLGDENSADEVIVFGSSKEMGFGIVRILGNNMQANQMATLATALQSADFDESKLEGIFNFFK